jgi:hypothetical protein
LNKTPIDSGKNCRYSNGVTIRKKWSRLLLVAGVFSVIALIFAFFSIVKDTTVSPEVKQAQKLLQGFRNYTKSGNDETSVKQEANEAVIRQKIIAEEAKLRGITVSEEEINAEYISRQNKVGGPDKLLTVLKNYNWTAADLRSQIKFQLLEKKVSQAVSGHIHVQEIVFWPQKEKYQTALNFAAQAKRDFDSFKTFQDIVKTASVSAKNADIGFQSVEIQDLLRGPSDLWQSEVLEFLKGLPINDARVYKNNMMVIVARLVSKKEGPKFEEWYKEKRSKTTSYIKPAYAEYRENRCGTGTWCVDNITTSCGDVGGWYCDSTSCSGTPGFPTCCISTGGFVGVVKDGISGGRINGATVNGYNNYVCSGGNYHNHTEITYTDTASGYGEGFFYLQPFNCYGGNVNVVISKAGYITNTYTVSIINDQVFYAGDFFIFPTTSPAKYRCQGSSCIRDDAAGSYSDASCGGACPPSCVNINTYVDPNPVGVGSSFIVDFTAATGYMDISFDPGGGASCSGPSPACCDCGNPHGDNRCWWRFNCTASGTPGGYNGYFNNSSGCAANANYTVFNPCTNRAPAQVNLSYPANNATGIPKNVSLQWAGLADWGVNCAGGSNSYTLSWRDITTSGAWTTSPATTATAYLLPTLINGHRYSWYVTANNGALSSTSALWTFTVINTLYYQVTGGDVYGTIITSQIPSTIPNVCQGYINLSN